MLLFRRAKQESKQQSVYESVSSDVLKEMNSAKQTSLHSANNSNVLKIKVKKMEKGCPMDIQQSIKSNQMTVAVVDNTLINSLKETVKRDLQQAASGKLEKKTDIFGTVGSILGGGTDQNVDSNTKASIINTVNKTFSTESVNEAIATVKNRNEFGIDIEVCNAPIDIAQEIANTQTTESLMKTLRENMKEVEVDEILDQDASGDVSQEDTTVSSITDMIANLGLGYSAMIGSSFCAIVCVCMGLMVFALSPAGQNMARNTNIKGTISSFRAPQ